MRDEREFGEQPLAALMARHELTAHDLVVQSTEQLTHKMVARAVKGRRLTFNAMSKVLNSLNRAASSQYTRADLFNYPPADRANRDELS